MLLDKINEIINLSGGNWRNNIDKNVLFEDYKIMCDPPHTQFKINLGSP